VYKKYTKNAKLTKPISRAIKYREGDSWYSLWEIAKKLFLGTKADVNGNNFRCPTSPQGNPPEQNL